MYTATFYEPRQKCRFKFFFQVRWAHKSGDVINFIILACRISSQLKWYKNYKNRLRLAKVIVKNKMSRFLWFTVYMKLYSANHGNSKDRQTDIYKESKHDICYRKVLTKCLTTTFWLHCKPARNVLRLLIIISAISDCPV